MSNFRTNALFLLSFGCKVVDVTPFSPERTSKAPHTRGEASDGQFADVENAVIIDFPLSTALALALLLLVHSDALKSPHGKFQRCEAPLAVSPFETEATFEERAYRLWLAEVRDEANAAAEATLQRFQARQSQTAQATKKVKTEAKAARLEAEAKARAETEAKRIARLKTAGKKQEFDRSPQGAFCAAMCAAFTTGWPQPAKRRSLGGPAVGRSAWSKIPLSEVL